MSKPPITSKQQMYELLNRGSLGNHLPSVETLPEAWRLVHDDPGPFAIRWKQSGAKTEYNLSARMAWEIVHSSPEGSWNLSGMMDDTKRVCYAHLVDAIGGWDLHYSTDPKPCKLVESIDGCGQKHLRGLSARIYLRSVCDPQGYDLVCGLLDDYPDHVVEFSVMSDRKYAYGPTNVLIWEVRCTTGEYEYSSGWRVK